MIAACTGAGLAVAAGGLYAALLTGLVQLNHPSTAKYPVRGIDVSHHQGTIDWPEVKAAGIAFAYLKATEGGDYVDSRFAENRAGARAAGLVVGAYHFFTFCRDGATQARGFIDTVPFDLDGLPPALDIEFGGNCARRPAPAEVEGEVQAWLRMVRAVYRREPVIYVTRELLEAYPGIAEAAPLWVRDVFGSPDWARRPWKLWQYTNRGHVPGISGPVDLDVLQGSDEALARESGVTLGPPPEAVAPPADGDTRPCTDGIREACARLAGIGVEERARDDADGWRVTAEWVRFARRACHLGDGECCGLLGTSALNNLPASQFPHFAWHGRPVVPSQEDSVPSTLELLLRSCELGSVEGCEHAAWSGADDPRLRGFLERSCEGGHAAACHARGHLGANDGPPTDRPWYEKGCPRRERERGVGAARPRPGGVLPRPGGADGEVPARGAARAAGARPAHRALQFRQRTRGAGLRPPGPRLRDHRRHQGARRLRPRLRRRPELPPRPGLPRMRGGGAPGLEEPGPRRRPAGRAPGVRRGIVRRPGLIGVMGFRLPPAIAAVALRRVGE